MPSADEAFAALMETTGSALLLEEKRCQLIGDIVQLLEEYPVPAETREAALTFVCWLARRMPWDEPSNDLAKQPECAELRRLIARKR